MNFNYAKKKLVNFYFTKNVLFEVRYYCVKYNEGAKKNMKTRDIEMEKELAFYYLNFNKMSECQKKLIILFFKEL